MAGQWIDYQVHSGLWCCTLVLLTLCQLAASSGDCRHVRPFCICVLASGVHCSSGPTCFLADTDGVARNPAAIEQNRNTLQRRARSICIAEGGVVLKHPSIFTEQILPDGVHLNAVGMNMFIDDLSTGLQHILCDATVYSSTSEQVH